MKSPVAQIITIPLLGGRESLKIKPRGDFLKFKPHHSLLGFKTPSSQRINSQVFSLVDEALQKLAPLQPHLWLSFSKTTANVQLPPGHTLFYTPLPLPCWWNFWLCLSYHTHASTGCYYSTSTSSGDSEHLQSKEGQCFILPHTSYKVQHTAPQ